MSLRTVLLQSQRIISAIFLACSWLWSNPSAATDIDDYLRQFHEDEIQEVLVGETPMPFFEFSPSTPISKGTVILFASEGLSSLTLDASFRLAQQLNDIGWYTVIAPVSPVANMAEKEDMQPEQEDMMQAAEMPRPITRSTQESLNYDASLTQLSGLTQQLVRYAQKNPGYLVFVGQGVNAAQLLALMSEAQIVTPDAMISVSPFWPEREQNMQVPQHIAGNNAPTLDIGLPNANQWDAATIALRKKTAVTSLKLFYRQRTFPGTQLYSPGYGPESLYVNWLSSEIYGWLTYLGW